MSADTVRLDRYAVDVLMRDLTGHDRRASTWLVWVHLATRPEAQRGRPVAASYADVAFATGLSKSAVQGAVRHLKRRRLVRVERESPTATPIYEVLQPWRR